MILKTVMALQKSPTWKKRHECRIRTSKMGYRSTQLSQSKNLYLCAMKGIARLLRITQTPKEPVTTTI